MKFFHYLFGLILLALLVGAGAFVAHAVMVPDLYCQVINMLKVHRILVLDAIGGIICVVILYLLTGVKRKSKERFITFDNEGGSVSISLRALHDVLEKLGDEFAAILSLDTDVRPVGDALEIEMDVRVRSGTQIPELCRLLQGRVKESIRDEMGLSEVKGVKINVREIVTPPSGKGGKSGQQEPEEWEGSLRP